MCENKTLLATNREQGSYLQINPLHVCAGTRNSLYLKSTDALQPVKPNPCRLVQLEYFSTSIDTTVGKKQYEQKKADVLKKILQNYH